jgi:D-glycero-alpha-D-manno-heptose-7-phosphate kinase
VLITTRTPLRASFVGGGTDLPSYYRVHGGAVVATALSLHVDVSVRCRSTLTLPRYRVACETYEQVDERDAISHPIVREALRMLEIDEPLDIVSYSDVPSGTGLGSSSSFTVGLLHALELLRGREPDPFALADAAFELEVEILGAPIGRQDQTIAALGGFHRLHFAVDERVTAEPIITPASTHAALERACLLFYLGGRRHAGELLQTLAKPSAANNEGLHGIARTCVAFERALQRGASLVELGAILDESWQLKRSLARGIAPPVVDDAYAAARQNGACGGKLLGAGGTGCLLLLAEPEHHARIRAVLSGFAELGFRLGARGTRALLRASEACS